jgi:diguanylate cyclase (GGDEF)-like protein
MRAGPPSRKADPRTREELLSILESPTAPDEAVDRRIQEISRQGELPVHAALLGLLLQAEMSEEEASRHWNSLRAHRKELQSLLGRDPGSRVAALDYFTLQGAFLACPVVVDGIAMDRTLDAAWADGLTSLVSPRHFQDALKREIRRATRRGQDFSLALVDLDDFTRVNARSGRASGDDALRQVAEILRGRLRDADVAGRIGGARFSLILPGTRRSGAYVVSERIRAAVEERFRHPRPAEERLLLTVSAGTATFPADGKTREELLRHAERALDRARRMGGNTVVLREEDQRRTMRMRPLGTGLAVEAFRRAQREPVRLKAIDLSGSGALLESPCALEIGEDLELRFPDLLPSGGFLLPSRVERAWKTEWGGASDSFRAGVRFLPGRNGSREVLDSLIAVLRGRGIEQGDS